MESHKNLQTSSLRGALQTLRVRFFFESTCEGLEKRWTKIFLVCDLHEFRILSLGTTIQRIPQDTTQLLG